MPKSQHGEIKCGQSGCGLPPRFHAINLPEVKATRDANRTIIKLDVTGNRAHNFVFNG